MLTLAAGLLTDGQFSGTISGFAEEDRIELSGLGATEATLGEGNLLTITGGANGPATLQLDPAADFTGMAFSARFERQRRQLSQLRPGQCRR